jgi:hypothetical protein
MYCRPHSMPRAVAPDPRSRAVRSSSFVKL